MHTLWQRCHWGAPSLPCIPCLFCLCPWSGTWMAFYAQVALACSLVFFVFFCFNLCKHLHLPDKKILSELFLLLFSHYSFNAASQGEHTMKNAWRNVSLHLFTFTNQRFNPESVQPWQQFALLTWTDDVFEPPDRLQWQLQNSLAHLQRKTMLLGF